MGKYLDLIATSRSCEISEVSRGGVLSSLNSQLRPALDDDFHVALRALDARCPDRVENYERWRQAVADGGTFLATWGDRARALGWTVDDLFGLHPVAPLARYDAMGLVWLLRGRPVVAMAWIVASIRSPSGAITMYRRSFERHVEADRPDAPRGCSR
jgi:hypothetical protein